MLNSRETNIVRTFPSLLSLPTITGRFKEETRDSYGKYLEEGFRGTSLFGMNQMGHEVSFILKYSKLGTVRLRFII